jgi:ComF family protein
MLHIVSEHLSALFDLFYPHVCAGCTQKLLQGEEVICFKCESSLPYTDYCKRADNAMAKRFWGRVELQGAAALLEFQKGEIVQHLLHQLKYRGRKDIGTFLGKLLGEQLITENSIIKDIDLIVPVPLHWKKEKIRGYNQCTPFAESLAATMGIPWSGTALQRTHENISQTKMNRFERYSNVEGIFDVTDALQLKNKHILLVDDVMTTGATAEACLHSILAVENTKASFATIAVALQ